LINFAFHTKKYIAKKQAIKIHANQSLSIIKISAWS